MKRDKMLAIFELLGTRKRVQFYNEQALSAIAVKFGIDIARLRQVVNVDDIMLRAANVLSENFKDEELDAAVAFFGSSDGMSFYRKMSSFLEQLTDVASKYTAEKIEQIQSGPKN